MKRIVLVLLAIGLSGTAYSQSTPPRATSFHDQVTSAYGVSPRNLSKDKISAKSRELDEFWSILKARGDTGLTALREELRRADVPVFFNYDGAQLLQSLSTAPADRALALSSITRADLRDLKWNDYFLTIHSFAVDGLDTTDAAFTILGEETFSAYIPQHALTLEQERCLLFLLLPTAETFYLEKAERRLFAEKSVVAQKSLLTLLAYTVTKRGDEAITRFRADASQPGASREYAKLIMDSTAAMTAMPLFGLSFSSYDELKREQRQLFARVSDEALSEEERLRSKLRHKGAR